MKPIPNFPNCSVLKTHKYFLATLRSTSFQAKIKFTLPGILCDLFRASWRIRPPPNVSNFLAYGPHFVTSSLRPMIPILLPFPFSNLHDVFKKRNRHTQLDSILMASAPARHGVTSTATTGHNVPLIEWISSDSGSWSAPVSVTTGFYGRELSTLNPTTNLEDQGTTLSLVSHPSSFSAWVTLPGVLYSTVTPVSLDLRIIRTQKAAPPR